jgi:hypothetical protein
LKRGENSHTERKRRKGGKREERGRREEREGNQASCRSSR